MFSLLLPFFCNVRPGRTNLQSRSSAVHRSAQQRQLLAKGHAQGAHTARSRRRPRYLKHTNSSHRQPAHHDWGSDTTSAARPGTATLGGDSGVTTPSFSASFLSHIGPSSGGPSVNILPNPWLEPSPDQHLCAECRGLGTIVSC